MASSRMKKMLATLKNMVTSLEVLNYLDLENLKKLDTALRANPKDKTEIQTLYITIIQDAEKALKNKNTEITTRLSDNAAFEAEKKQAEEDLAAVTDIVNKGMKDTMIRNLLSSADYALDITYGDDVSTGSTATVDPIKYDNTIVFISDNIYERNPSDNSFNDLPYYVYIIDQAVQHGQAVQSDKRLWIYYEKTAQEWQIAQSIYPPTEASFKNHSKIFAKASCVSPCYSLPDKIPPGTWKYLDETSMASNKFTPAPSLRVTKVESSDSKAKEEAIKAAIKAKKAAKAATLAAKAAKEDAEKKANEEERTAQKNNREAKRLRQAAAAAAAAAAAQAQAQAQAPPDKPTYPELTGKNDSLIELIKDHEIFFALDLSLGRVVGVSGIGVDNYDALLEAIKVGDLDTVARLIDIVGVNTPDKNKSYEFNNFAQPGKEKMVNVGMTPIFYAVSRYMKHKHIDDQYLNPARDTKDNHYKIAELLISKGADVNYQTPEWFTGWSPIHWALEYMNMDMYNLLISNGADVTHRYKTSHTETYGMREIFFRYQEYPDMQALGSKDQYIELATNSRPFSR